MIVRARQPDHGRGHGRDGFTLIEIIIAVAIVAILAGAITPLAFRELVSAREEATERELAAIKHAMLDFYEDTGRFPDEGEGLGALLSDPGVSGWQGPYLEADSGDPLTELGTDAFGRAYVYDLSPATTPAGAADAIVASGGADRAWSLGGLNQPWHLTADGDDLVSLISAGSLDRDKSLACMAEITAIGDAARSFYEDNAAFPATLGELTDTYLDAGIANANLIDPWRNPYVLGLSGGFGAPQVLTVRSFGPDRANDDGGDDDISLAVSSVPPGRTATQRKLTIAQTALNNNPTTVLTGVWSSDRVSLNLSDAFVADGWGRSFAVDAVSRIIYSVGPDGNGATVDDNLPTGVGGP